MKHHDLCYILYVYVFKAKSLKLQDQNPYLLGMMSGRESFQDIYNIEMMAQLASLSFLPHLSLSLSLTYTITFALDASSGCGSTFIIHKRLQRLCWRQQVLRCVFPREQCTCQEQSFEEDFWLENQYQKCESKQSHCCKDVKQLIRMATASSVKVRLAPRHDTQNGAIRDS